MLKRTFKFRFRFVQGSKSMLSASLKGLVGPTDPRHAGIKLLDAAIAWSIASAPASDQ